MTPNTEGLQQIWNRLRILVLTLDYASTELESSDLPTIGDMIEDLLVDQFQPIIDELEAAKEQPIKEQSRRRAAKQ